MLILHATSSKLGTPMLVLKDQAEFYVLAGPEKAFAEREADIIHDTACGRLIYIQPQLSAFSVVADTIRLFGNILQQRLRAIDYRRLSDASCERFDWCTPLPGIAWRKNLIGEITDLHFGPVIATSPLLPRLTEALKDQANDDTRRLEFLTAEFARM